MKVYLVRHGIAVERLGGAILSDAQRPLTDDGKAETRIVAQALKKLGIRGELVISSPLVRARQTAEIIHAVIGSGKEVEITDALAPAGDFSLLFKFINKFQHVDEIFCVGHEPDIGRLAANLIWGPEVDIPFKKAAVCRIDVNSLPASYPGILKWFITPKIANLIAGK